jgi:hypothetical protein
MAIPTSAEAIAGASFILYLNRYYLLAILNLSFVWWTFSVVEHHYKPSDSAKNLF